MIKYLISLFRPKIIDKYPKMTSVKELDEYFKDYFYNESKWLDLNYVRKVSGDK